MGKLNHSFTRHKCADFHFFFVFEPHLFFFITEAGLLKVTFAVYLGSRSFSESLQARPQIVPGATTTRQLPLRCPTTSTRWGAITPGQSLITSPLSETNGELQRRITLDNTCPLIIRLEPRTT